MTRNPRLATALSLGIVFVCVLVFAAYKIFGDKVPYSTQPMRSPPTGNPLTQAEWEKLLLESDYSQDFLTAKLAGHGADLQPLLNVFIRVLDGRQRKQAWGAAPTNWGHGYDQYAKPWINRPPTEQEWDNYKKNILAIVGVLQRMGPAAKPAVPLLMQHAYSTEYFAVIAIDPDAPGLEDGVVARLNFGSLSPEDIKISTDYIKSRGPAAMEKAKRSLLANSPFRNVESVLIALGLDPLSFFMAELGSADVATRQQAAGGLATWRNSFGGRPQTTSLKMLDAIIQALLTPRLKDGDDLIRHAAYRGLASALTTAELAAAIDDSYEPIRQIALDSMKKRPDVAKLAIPALKKLAGDPASRLGFPATLILLRLPPADSGWDRPQTIAAIGRVLAGSTDEQMILDALAVLKKLPGEGIDPELIPALEKVLTRNDVAVRTAAFEAFARIGPDAKASVPKMIEAIRKTMNTGLNSGELSLRTAAARALRKVAPGDPKTIGIFVEMFEDPNAAYQAIEGLLLIGEPAVPELLKALSDKDSNVVDASILALKCMGHKAAAAVPALIERLRTIAEKHGYIEEKTAEALAWIGKPATQPLAEGLRHQNAKVRRAMATTLAKMGPEAGEVMPALERAVRDRDVIDLVQKAIYRSDKGGHSFENMEEIQRIGNYTIGDSWYPFDGPRSRERAKKLFDMLQGTQIGKLDPKDKDRWTMPVLGELGKYYRETDGDLDTTIRIYEMIRAKRSGPDDHTHQATYLLGFLYHAADRHADAVKMYEELFGRIKAINATGADMMATYGSSLLKLKRPAEAEAKFRECLALREKFGPELWNKFNAQALLGISLLQQKKVAEAQPLLEAGYLGLKEREAKIPEEARRLRLETALRALIECAEANGKPDDAERWRKELPKLPVEIAPKPR